MIIVSQFMGTSLWFAGNAVIDDLQRDWMLGEQVTGAITAAVQLGFIAGTLVFAFLAIADRFSPRLVFLLCALAAAFFNLGTLVIPEGLSGLLFLRFATGFFLAGIYPVGMKIAAGWYAEGLGRALGYLVGALVLGTAFPHLVRAAGSDLPWQWVIASVSGLAALGGLLMYQWVPDGPHLAPPSRFNPRALILMFRAPAFRAAACGYFGHMWELYAFWAFAPVWLAAYASLTGTAINIPLWSFLIIGIGFFGCSLGGLLSTRYGSAKVAFWQLLVSGACCLLSPLLFGASFGLLAVFLLLWGLTVSGDSPQLSALNARHAPPDYVGSALTIANSIGFLITIFSIQLLDYLLPLINTQNLFLILLPGPLLGLWMLKPLLKTA